MWHSVLLDGTWTSGSRLFERWMVRFVVATCLITIICAPPVKHKKTPDLKEELGPMYDSFVKLQTELKVMYLKELVAAAPEERAKVHERWKEIMRQHVPVHSPGSIEQLKETWHEDDDMDDDSYSLQSLFRTHDYDNDGFLSEDEVRALYYSELERAYPDRNPAEDKMRELMSTEMLGSILKRIDTNKDGKISYFEFINYQPQHDEGFEWTDEGDLPDLEHAKDDKLVVEAVQKDLEAHPNDTVSEELMHKISGMEVLQGKKTVVDAYSPHKSHDHPTPQHMAAHGSQASSTPAPHPATKA